MKRRDFVKHITRTAIGGLTLSTLSTKTRATTVEEIRPNVILIMDDDRGWGDLGFHGNDKIDTPVLDEFAQKSVRFERFYVEPVCAPTRASLLTGRYCQRTGAVGVSNGYENMNPDEITLAEVFKDSGYITGCFGKWHNGVQYPYHPNGQGFDEFFGLCAGGWSNYFDTRVQHNDEWVETRGYITDVLTDAALDFIELNKKHPFFCYLPYNAPHTPYQVPDRYFEKYKERGFSDAVATLYGMAENIDENIGRVLKKVDELDLTQKTIVIYLTDNGPRGAEGDRYNGGMRGKKGSVHEGGVRVPFFIRWPGHLQEDKSIQPIAAHIDVLPTLVELCHLNKPETLPLDGVSLVPLLKDEVKYWPDRKIYHLRFPQRKGYALTGAGSVRTDRYRLVFENDQWHLYDMIKDPDESNNIADHYPAVVERLVNEFEHWYADVTSMNIRKMPIPVGYPEWPRAVLPAHQGYMKGGVSWKIPYGWGNNWFSNWKDVNGYVWWDIDVVQKGRFLVTLKYTVPQKDVGAKVRIEAGKDSMEGLIDKAHDPDYIPSPDRYPRVEAYEKEWAFLDLGVIEMMKGRTKFKVKALSKPGDQVIELKDVILTRID